MTARLRGAARRPPLAAADECQLHADTGSLADVGPLPMAPGLIPLESPDGSSG